MTDLQAGSKGEGTHLDDVDVNLMHSRVVIGLSLKDGRKQATHQGALEHPG